MTNFKKIEDTKVLCYYHSRDLDGWMSAAIVKYHYQNAVLIGWDYGDPMPDVNDVSNMQATIIIIVDICFDPNTMKKFMMQSKWAIWIDHHVSAIEDSKKYGFDNILGLRNTKLAACELTWLFFSDDRTYSDKPPRLIELLGLYDSFRHKGTEEEQYVLEFQYGARQMIKNPADAKAMLVISRGRGDWSFENDLINEIWAKGQHIYEYLKSEAMSIYKKKFTILLDGYYFACINQQRFNPASFGIKYHEDMATMVDHYDGFACFWYDKGKFVYSIYNDDGNIDCSLIASRRGGGGHKGAAGFILDHVIEEIKY